MKYAILALALLALIAVAAALKTPPKNRKSAPGKISKKPLLSDREAPMFWRLCEAFPQSEYVVLTQVALGGILTTKNRVDRNRFDRKIADFVITNKAFEVLAVIELDDKSHRGKEEKDAERDQMLQAAGYKTLRYKDIPETGTLRTDLKTVEK